MNKPTGVPVTGAFLSFVAALQAAKEMYLHEELMASDLGFDMPDSWYDRCFALFMDTYSRQAEAIGLSLDEQTFRALLGLVVPDEAKSLPASDLPKSFAFDPKRGVRNLLAAQGFSGSFALA